MKPSIYQVETPFTGSLYVMPKPSGEWLTEDLAHFKNIGIDHIVSLLWQDEIRELSLENQPSLCSTIGVKFTNFPIVDRGLPEIAGFTSMAKAVFAELSVGKSIAIHCRAGIGRTGMLACCLLKMAGIDNEEALELVSRARGVQVPDTILQRQFITDYQLQ